MNVTAHNCLLCGSEKNSLLYKNDDVRYLLCEHCSLVFLSPRPTEADLDAFYQLEYQRHRHALLTYEEAVKQRESKGLESKRHYLNDLNPYIDTHTRVLEIGCGWGALLRLIKDTHACDVIGVEISSLAAEVAERYYQLPVFRGTLSQFYTTHKGKTFDVIILIHVLEHFSDPKEALSFIKALLSKNGIVYFAVPNLLYPNEPLDRFFHFEHIHYFTPWTLALLLKRNGFKILWSEATHEIKMIATRATDERKEIDTSSFEHMYTKGNIRKVLARQSYKYSVLRALKGVTHALLPEKIFHIVRKRIVSILKRLRIIDI